MSDAWVSDAIRQVHAGSNPNIGPGEKFYYVCPAQILKRSSLTKIDGYFLVTDKKIAFFSWLGQDSDGEIFDRQVPIGSIQTVRPFKPKRVARFLTESGSWKYLMLSTRLPTGEVESWPLLTSKDDHLALTRLLCGGERG